MKPEKYWSTFFGLTIEEFKKPGCTVAPHKELAGYNGAWIFKINQSVIISVPNEIKETVSAHIKSYEYNDIALTEAFANQIFKNVERTIGPCYQGYCAEDTLMKIDDKEIRMLTESDQILLKNFQIQIDQEAWEHSSMAPDKVSFGYFQNGAIVAAACLDMWSENVANIGLITHPSMQGKGCAKKLCSKATRFGLDNGYEMVYQTLLSNLPAVSIAQSTGYIEYANHLAVRFKTAI